MDKVNKFKDIDSYLGDFPDDVRARLQAVRALIRQTAPAATEAISYQIPTFKLGKNLVHFAGFKNHLGFYPGAEALVHFADALTGWATAKGSIQFPHDRPLPLDLIRAIVAYRVVQNEEALRAAKSRGRTSGA